MEAPTKPDAPRGRVRRHIIDQAADWSAIVGAVGVAIAMLVGAPIITELAAEGRLPWLVGLVLAFSLTAAAVIFRFLISPAVGEQIRGLADVAESIAGGDLTQRPDAADEGGQLGRLGRAMVEMTSTLRRLASLIRENAGATQQRASEITASTEHLAQAASGVAETASALSLESATMAETIRGLSGDATRLAQLAAGVSDGANDGLRRNRELSELAAGNAGHLDEGARRLDELASDVRAGAAATEALAGASEEILAFVALVQRIAKQSKLLAMNASMEASRAGEHGEGFTVVANEVRRLAQATQEAASKTDVLMKDLIAQVEAAHASAVRSRATVETVRATTSRGREAFSSVELAVAAGDGWISSMSATASSGQQLAREITEKLESLSRGTRSFADSMQDVAAASEEQSASTEEIAAAASSLLQSAEKVGGAAAGFRTSTRRADGAR
ncbi:MAG: methyl-accepting chemotaxis protein [Gemmatimonadaceae bacterium]|nr:methyl-accepting chemotaxis protein [Gemmatimonadaceae bacterium]